MSKMSERKYAKKGMPGKRTMEKRIRGENFGNERLKIKRDDFFTMIFALLGIALIVAFYFYLSGLR